MATLEIVAAVAIDDPETVAKAAHATIAEMARPPGICPSQTVAARKPFSEIPAENAMCPMNKNRGITINANSAVTEYGSVPSK
jgi:hypothetical protein